MKKVGQATQDTGKAGDKAFGTMAMGAVKSIAGIAGLSLSIGGLVAVMRQVYQISVDIARAEADITRAQQERMRGAASRLGAPGIRSLADIRGATPESVQADILRRASQFDLTPEAVQQALFLSESGIQPGQVGGAENFRAIQNAALQTASVTGASGETAGGMLITAREAMGAQTPEQFKQFLAKGVVVARQSRITFEEFGSIMNEVLPEAVKRGIDPDQFMALAASMSFRIKEPRMVRTALRQMMRATQDAGPKLESVARSLGKSLQGASPIQIMEIQAAALEQAAAQGPQAMGRMVKQLGLPEEISGVMLSTMDAASGERRAALGAAAAGAQFNKEIEAKFGLRMDSPAADLRRAAMAGRASEFEFGAQGSILEAQRIMTASIDAGRGVAGYAQRELTFSRGMARKWEPLSAEESAKVFGLNEIADRVVPALERMIAANRPAAKAWGPEESIGGRRAFTYYRASDLRDRVISTRNAANSYQWLGEQRHWIPKYEQAIQDAIEFLRSAQIGDVTEGGARPGFYPAEFVPLGDGLPADIFGVGAGMVPGASPAGGVTVNINQQYNTQPADVANTDKTRINPN